MDGANPPLLWGHCVHRDPSNVHVSSSSVCVPSPPKSTRLGATSGLPSSGCPTHTPAKHASPAAHVAPGQHASPCSPHREPLSADPASPGHEPPSHAGAVAHRSSAQHACA